MKSDFELKLALPTDAISMDIETSFLIGLDWGINVYELKRLFNKRLPSFNQSDVEYIKKSVKKNNVKICSLSPGFFKDKIASELTKNEISNFDKLLDFADEFETNKIVVFGFKYEKVTNFSQNEIVPKIIDIYEKLLKKCIKRKITLLVENDRGHYANNKDILVKIFKELSDQNFKLNWDPCNCVGEKDSEIPFPDFYSSIKNKIGHLHIKDAIKNGESFKNVMIGNGEVNWRDQIKALKKDNYSGYYVIEPHFGHRIHSTYDHIMSFKKIYSEA